MGNRVYGLIVLSCLIAVPSAEAANVRAFTRSLNDGTAVTQNQASELTLTLTDVAMRPIQNWVRTAGSLDSSGKLLTTFVPSPDGELIEPGQRFRAFTVNSRTRMHQGKISRVTKQPGGMLIEGALPAKASEDAARYLMEIVVERGPYLSIPNVSIIEEGAEHIVYVQEQPGKYVPRAIDTGLQGELYTQVVGGLKNGDQVVSIGSFFIDAENKLKSAGMAAMPGMDHGAMAGMDHSAMAGMDHTLLAAAKAPAAPSGAPAAPTIMTDPGPGATVKAPLMMIHVMFSAPVDTKAAGFEVTDAQGRKVDVGEAMAMGTDGKMLMAMPKTPLPAGTYKVKWHTVDANGRPLQGEFMFTAQ